MCGFGTSSKEFLGKTKKRPGWPHHFWSTKLAWELLAVNRIFEGDPMAFSLAGYFHQRGLKIVEYSVKSATDRPISFVKQEAQYRQQVIQPAWNALPVAIRLLMKRRFQDWDKLYLTLREEVFDLRGEKVKLHPESSAKIAALVKRFYGSEEPTSPSFTPDGSWPRKEEVPLAQPVVGSNHPVPLAKPVAKSPTAESRLPKPGSPEGRSVSTPLGIDLGTTYSVIAYVDGQGRPCSCLNADGDRLTPSVVLFEEGGTVVGKQALLASAMEPEKTADCVKRDMGCKVYRRKINGEFMPPEVISSFILRSLKADAERQLGVAQCAVITVPAYFDETRRRATVAAGKLAGLDVLDIINEPTAAAISYGYQLGFLDQRCQLASDRPLRVLVFDLGGGTFDVTIVAIQRNTFKALATDGDVHLGGKDWDEKLVEIAADQFRHQFREDPRDHPASRQGLWLAAENAKRSLTERTKVNLCVHHLGTSWKVEVTRQQFEQATQPLLERTRMTTEIVVRQAGLSFSDLDRILLVGGATRMPMVVRMLEELTGKTPDRSISVDEAVAHGAALYAQVLAKPAAERKSADFSITNINSHSLGIVGTDSTGHKVNKILIPKNTPLPCTTTKRFKTFKPNQGSVLIKVVEGESPRPEVCSQVGVCTISDLPPNLPAGWPILVSYKYQANGQLQVAAKVKGHGAGISTQFIRENSLPDEDLDMWSHFVEEELSN
jgi:molecular chaperone DnaK